MFFFILLLNIQKNKKGVLLKFEDLQIVSSKEKFVRPWSRELRSEKESWEIERNHSLIH